MACTSRGAVLIDIEILIVFLALGLLAVPVVAVIALVLVVDARREIRMLTARLAGAEAALARLAQAPPEAPAPDQPSPEPEASPAMDEASRVARSEDDAARESPPESPATPVEPSQAQALPEAGASRPGLEERLGTRWAVWIGGLALGLGGIFLVRFSLEQGLLGPGARIGLGAAFAALLLGLGEYLRRRDLAIVIPGLGPAHAAAVVTAAGAASAFGTAYAAFALYGFIGPAMAIILLGVIGVATMLAAALHGPLLASLGLIGAFVAPILTGGDGAQTWPLVPYFAAVAGAAYAVARLRGWRGLALWTAVAALIWAALLLDGPALPAMLHLLVQTGLIVLIFAILPWRGVPRHEQPLDRVAHGVLAGAVLVFVLASDVIAPGASMLWFPIGMVLICLAAAHRPALAGGAMLALVVTLAALWFWPVLAEAAREPTRILPGPAGPVPQPASIATFMLFAGIGAFLIAGFGLWQLLQREDADGRVISRPAMGSYAAAFATAPTLILMIVYWRLTGAGSVLAGVADPPFALAAAGLAALYAAAARAFYKGESSGEGAQGEARHLLAGLAASAALGALALALVFQLDRGMLTIAFALAALGSAYVCARLDLPLLRYGTALIGLVVAGRLAWDPGIVDGDPGAVILLNWLLPAYGIPALAFLAASILLGRQGRDWVARLCESLGLAFAAFLVLFQMRHALHGGDLLAPTSSHLEMGTLTLTALLFAFILVHVDRRRPDAVSRIGARVFGLVALASTASGLLFAWNPLLTGERILGGPVFNSLLPAYLFPAIVAAGIALYLWRFAESSFLTRLQCGCMAGLALVLQAAWSVMAIRTAFQGPHIGLWRATGDGELWSYSAMLLFVGLAALFVGLRRDWPWLRLVAAAYLAIAVLKVFFVDLAGLQGVMRAASFIVLGLVLVGVGLIYQRLLARRVRET